MKIRSIVNGVGNLSIISGSILLFGLVGGMDFEEVSGVRVPLEEYLRWGVLSVLLMLYGYFSKEAFKQGGSTDEEVQENQVS